MIQKNFLKERSTRIDSYSVKADLLESGHRFLMESLNEKYSYNFSWLGLPVIQYPQDIVALQEIIWETAPDLIIETGVARGGSLILYASLLEMLGNDGLVVGIDIDIRDHNRKRILSHALSRRIQLIDGSSTDPDTVRQVEKIVLQKKRVMVALDSNHTHDHVLSELNLYTPFVTKGCYCIVFDTIVQSMAEGSFPDRPWDKDNNPGTAVQVFMKQNDEFVIDRQIEQKLIITCAPSGYLVRIKDYQP